MFEIDIDITDSVEPWCREVIRCKTKMRKEALGKLGGHLRKEIKKGMKSKSPGGSPYKKTMKAKDRRKLEQAFGAQPKRSYPILGRLYRAVGFEMNTHAEILKVGMLSKSAKSMMFIHEKGTKRRVTPFIRRKYFQAGLGISPKKQFINIPQRATFEPLKKKLVPTIPGYVQDSIADFLENGIKKPPPRRRKRKYKVY